MNKYLVSVAEREILVATWEVEAKDQEEAEKKYYDGHGNLVSREVSEGEQLNIISVGLGGGKCSAEKK